MKTSIPKPTVMDTRFIEGWMLISDTIILNGSILHWTSKPRLRYSCEALSKRRIIRNYD